MSQTIILNLFQQLGIDAEAFTWESLAGCAQAPVNWFFDDYENNKTVATQVDQMCLKCPVMQECFRKGTSNKEYGVWGGMYLNNGKVDPQKNKHKTESLARAMAERLYDE